MKETRSDRKVQTNKTNHMSDEAFADLKEVWKILWLMSVKSATRPKLEFDLRISASKSRLKRRFIARLGNHQFPSGCPRR